MKKIPPWALIAGAVAVGAVIWLIKKRREDQTALEANEGASEAPVVAEGEGGEPYPISGYGGGAGLGSGGALGNANETQQELRELFGESERRRLESEGNQLTVERSIQEALTRNQQTLEALTAPRQQSTINQGSGGGAPENNRQGTTSAPKTQGATCGQGQFSGYPNGSAPNCWRVSRTRTGGGCECHAHYGNNTLECQHGKSPHCTW